MHQIARVDPYRDPDVPQRDIDGLWHALDESLSYAFNDPAFAYLTATWVFMDAVKAEAWDVVAAADAFMAALVNR